MKQTEVYDLPVSVQIDITTGEFSPCPEMVDRKVSDLAVMFYNQEVVNGIISSGDRLVYQNSLLSIHHQQFRYGAWYNHHFPR